MMVYSTYEGLSHFLDLNWTPIPQVLEQTPQDVQLPQFPSRGFRTIGTLSADLLPIFWQYPLTHHLNGDI